MKEADMPEARFPRTYFSLMAVLMLMAALSACGVQSESSSGGEPTGAAAEMGNKLRVVATTTIVGDVVHVIGGDKIELTTLMPRGTDPHSFDPSPRDAAAVADAHVVFMNGVGLEAFLEPMLENAGGEAEVVNLAEGIELRKVEGEQKGDQEQGGDAEHGQGDYDPHVWFDPHNVMVWVKQIDETLSRLDAANAQAYSDRAQAYLSELGELDRWIREQVEQVPEANRNIVADHDTFGYLAERYGLQTVGTIIPGYSTLSEPSAQELADLESAIQNLDVKAIFVGKTVNPNLARPVEEDTGVRLVFLYTGSLSEPGGPAGSYLEFMRYDVSEIVEALKQ
jgi:ABC-type Zn uptake system ZnuABC Zn-binding protein ZnuA